MSKGEIKGVEIFNVGVHRGKDFTEKDIHQIIANFHRFGTMVQPPMVLGHGEEDEQFLLGNSGIPAAGWLTALRGETRGGKVTLVADFKDVPEIVRAVIKRRAFKRISAELYPDFLHEGKGHGLMLRRVALLGGEVPEVKDLADVVALGDVAEPIFAHSEGEKTMPEPNKPEDTKGTSEVEALKKQLAEANDKLSSQSGKLDVIEKQNAEMAEAYAKDRLTRDRESITMQCDSLKKEGKLLPKWEEAGIKTFIEKLDDSGVLKYTDKEDAAEITPRKYFLDFLKALPDIVKMEEIAEGGNVNTSKGKVSDPGVKNTRLTDEAKKLMATKKAEGNEIKFAEAVSLVARANPSLVE